MSEQDPVIGTMVVCLDCKTIVWAHDEDHGDVRGLVNEFGLPCPKCRGTICFDGWRVRASQVIDSEYPDAWSFMREIAKARGLTWEPNGANRWPVAGGAIP